MVDQEKIHNQCLSKNPKERINAIRQFTALFSLLPDKQQAWNDLIRMITDKNMSVSDAASDVIVNVFSQVSNQNQAWNDVIILSNHENRNVRISIAYAIGSMFADMPNKQQTWDNLIEMAKEEDFEVSNTAARALDSAFLYVPDKLQAWKDLVSLMENAGSDVIRRVSHTLCSIFSYLPNKQEAWNDLHKLTNYTKSLVRARAAYIIGTVFSNVSDRQLAWNDLSRLSYEEDFEIRSEAASALCSAYSFMSEKQQAWYDLHRLTNDENWSVRSNTAEFIGSLFSDILDKQQASNDLHRLSNDEDSSVKRRAAEALGFIFSKAPDKKLVWNDLHRMTHDEDSHVRTSSNHSLGRISIFNASQADTEDEYKKELEKAIEFFEIAAKESESWNNPSQFCLPFYRSFHTIIFKRQEAKEEINKYLDEAKAAIEGSECKKQLFETVENLAKALKEVQSLGNLDLEAKKSELNFYRKYCDHAAELMKDTDEKAPFVTKVLRKGLPILNRNLKGLLEEIQEKAKAAYNESKGTTVEETARAVCSEVQKWEIGSQEEMSWYVEQLIFTLEASIPKEIENKAMFDKIKQIREERVLIKQYAILCSIIPMIPNLHIKHAISGLEKEVQQIKETVETLTISLKPGLKQEIEISSGIEICGTGAKLITTIPVQEISYPEIMKDLECIKEKNINKLSEVPERLFSKIKCYLSGMKEKIILSS